MVLRAGMPTVVAVAALLSALAGAALPLPARAQEQATVHIFFSAGCADCWPYVEHELMPALHDGGLDAQPEIHDYTIPAERARLLQMADDIDLPRSIADSLYAFVPVRGGTLLVLGHVPAAIIGQALTAPELPGRLVLWQPQMHGEPTEYRLWAWRGR